MPALARPTGFLIVSLWPSRDGSQAAAADPRRLAAVRQAELGARRPRKEHRVVERYLPFE